MKIGRWYRVRYRERLNASRSVLREFVGEMVDRYRDTHHVVFSGHPAFTTAVIPEEWVVSFEQMPRDATPVAPHKVRAALHR